MNLYLVITEHDTGSLFPTEKGLVPAVTELRRTFLAESFEVVRNHVAGTFADEQIIAIVDQRTVVTVLSHTKSAVIERGHFKNGLTVRELERLIADWPKDVQTK